ncbi:hypothetical protein EIP91_010868 [Steccherinum ochraceum]|uniref:MARVEL domain-containing protein n=1 Tax=Steccherinum ochraceum TaxID=92696 RepID=A0A4V2MUV8_9APHY|nr:hypothetical protein EIP91_010868 [Steccherinum ochraceum]
MITSYRYSLFALFLVFNAIICSVAVWNYTIAQALLVTANIDVYLAVIGGLSVLFIIPIAFVDVFRKNALTGRVWFELLWVGVFWILELCGAAAFTAQIPDTLCTTASTILQPDGCTSSRVLEAFAWLTTILLLFHLLALFVSALLHYDDDKEIWSASIRFYAWYSTRSTLESNPPSPTRSFAPSFNRRSFSLRAPKPKRPIRPADLDLEKAGATARPPMRDTSRSTVSRVAPPQQPPSMYPTSVAATMGNAARAPPASMRLQPTRPLRVVNANLSVSSPITEVPTPAPTGAAATSAARTPSPRSASLPKSAGTRPTHARGGSGSPTRRRPPPPLDLTRISAYNAIEERRKQQER